MATQCPEQTRKFIENFIGYSVVPLGTRGRGKSKTKKGRKMPKRAASDYSNEDEPRGKSSSLTRHGGNPSGGRGEPGSPSKSEAGREKTVAAGKEAAAECQQSQQQRLFRQLREERESGYTGDCKFRESSRRLAEVLCVICGKDLEETKDEAIERRKRDEEEKILNWSANTFKDVIEQRMVKTTRPLETGLRDVQGVSGKFGKKSIVTGFGGE